MSVVIELAPQGIEPSELARTVTSKFGSAVAIRLCEREIFLADWRSKKSDVTYWREARAEVELRSAGIVPEHQPPALVASAEEGVRLIQVFSRIANPLNRRALLELAASYLCKDVLD